MKIHWGLLGSIRACSSSTKQTTIHTLNGFILIHITKTLQVNINNDNQLDHIISPCLKHFENIIMSPPLWGGTY